jgi:hypothetical protein
MVGLNWIAQFSLSALGAAAGALAGVTFIVLASVSIQLDETLGPKLSVLTDSWSGASAVLGRKLTSLSH